MAKEIVLIGRSNVGKSTLFRKLTGKKVRVGRRPGVTLSPTKVQVGNVFYVDMPGYGYMKGMPRGVAESTKDFIVRYFEEGWRDIILAVQVVDIASFSEIVDRWMARGEVPLEVELYDFLRGLDIDVAVAANKVDRVANPDQVLDGIAERLGLPPPWSQWSDLIAPVSGKMGDIDALKKIIRGRL